MTVIKRPIQKGRHPEFISGYNLIEVQFTLDAEASSVLLYALVTLNLVQAI